MDKSYFLYVESYPEHIFQHWDIQENKNTITVKPVYREFTFTEKASHFITNLFR